MKAPLLRIQEVRAKALTPADMRTPAASLLVQAMTATGTSQRQLASSLGVSPALVARWCLDGAISLRYVLRLASCRPRLYHEMAESLRALAGVVRGVDSLERGVLVLQREAGELAGELLSALADGACDPVEARRVAREAADVVAAALGVQRRAEAIARGE